MEAGIILILGIVGLIIVAPIIALVRTGRLKRTAATQEELGNLTGRIYALEQQLKNLQATMREGAVAQAPAPAVAAEPANTKEPLVAATPKPPVATAPSPASAPTPASPTEVVKPSDIRPAVSPPALSTPTAPPTSTRPMPSVSAKSSVLSFGMAHAIAGETAPRASLEERLGTSWLNKIGITLLVLGVAYLLNYTLTHIGPVGKIATGYAVGAILIALGVIGERKERYRIAARAVLGGGWAIVYFTTYAMHNVAAVRLIESETLGFALLFVVAAVMVAHTLRYNSQVATGFAYLLGFASIGVSRIGVEGMVAVAVLVASIAVLLWRRKWYALEPPSVLSTYAVHWLWLQQIFERLGAHKPFPEFKASAALLTVYWIVWTVSYFSREERDVNERALLTASFFLNAGGYLAVLHQQSFYPQLRFWFLLAAGAVYLALAPVAKRLARRTGFVLTSTIGAALIGAAFPYRYSGGRLELLWLVEAEAFLAAGWRLAEKHLRRLGWVACAVLTIYLWGFPLSDRLSHWKPPDLHLGWELGAIAAAFFLNARLTKRLLGDDISKVDEAAAKISHGLATILLLATAWVALPFLFVGLAWTAIVVTLGEWGRWTKSAELRACEHGAALAALVRLLAINLPRSGDFHGVSLRLLTAGAAAALFFFEARRLRASSSATDDAGTSLSWTVRLGALPAAYSSSATLLAALIIWLEAANMAVGLAWGMLGLGLLEVGRALNDRALRAQGHVMLTASRVRVFIADLNGTAQLGPVSARVVTVTLLAAIYYYVAFTTPQEPAAKQKWSAPWVRPLFLWYAAAALVSLLRFEFEPSWLAVGWATLVVIFYRLGSVLPETAMRYQAYLVTLLAGARCAFDNFYQTTGRWKFGSLRVLTVVTASVLFYALLLRVLWDRRGRVKQPFIEADGVSIRRAVRWIDVNPHQLFFFAPTLLMTVLLSLEVRRGFLTAAWGAEALIVFTATLPLGERAFRWFSLALLLLSVGRVVSVDVWTLDPLGRIISFLALGAALLLVSFLYARYREFLRKYL